MLDVAYCHGWLVKLQGSEMHDADDVTITTLTFGIFDTSDETHVMLFRQY